MKLNSRRSPLDRLTGSLFVCCAALTAAGVTAASAVAEEEARQPTRAQLADLKQAVAEPGTAADDRLLKALLVAENEGLAQEVVRTARRLHEAGERGNPRNNLLYFLSRRAGTKKLNIDGPYLKQYAGLLLDIVESELADETGWGIQTNWGPLIVYLGAHADDRELKARVVKLALPLAKTASTYRLDVDAERAVSTAASHRAVGKHRFAVGVLFRLQVLVDGMSLAKAKEILGDPTAEKDQMVYWTVGTGFRGFDGLRADIEDGKVMKFVRL